MRCLCQVVYSLLFLLLFGFIMFQWKRFSTGNLLRCFLRKPKEHMILFKTTGKSGDKFSQFPPNVPSKMDHHNLPQNPKVLPKPHPENTSLRQPTGDRAIEAPEHHPCRCCSPSGSAVSPFCSPWGPQRWPAAPKASGPRRLTGAECQGGPGLGELWDAPAPVIGCSESMSTIGEFFGMIAPGFIQVLIG